MTERPKDLSIGGADRPTEADHRAEIAWLIDRLRLPRVSDPAPMGIRSLQPEPPHGLVSALLSEIDASVMARNLVVRAPGQPVLSLEVGNRRLLHFRFETTSEGDDPVEASLTFAGAADLDHLRNAVDLVCRDGPVTVEARAPTGIVTAEEAGVGLSALIDVLEGPNTAPGSTDEPFHLIDFVAEIGTDVVAWHLLTGEFGGDPDCAMALEQTLEEWCSQGFAPPEGMQATVLMATKSAGPVFFGQTEEDVLALILRQGAEDRAVAQWLAFVADHCRGGERE